MAEHIIFKRRGRLPSIEVVDLFCGIGGLSYGMKSKGFKILEGFDLDATCKYAYETNNEANSKHLSRKLRRAEFGCLSERRRYRFLTKY